MNESSKATRGIKCLLWKRREQPERRHVDRLDNNYASHSLSMDLTEQHALPRGYARNLTTHFPETQIPPTPYLWHCDLGLKYELKKWQWIYFAFCDILHPNLSQWQWHMQFPRDNLYPLPLGEISFFYCLAPLTQKIFSPPCLQQLIHLPIQNTVTPPPPRTVGSQIPMIWGRTFQQSLYHTALIKLYSF